MKNMNPSSSLQITCAQLNLNVGDFTGNCQKIAEAAERAYADGSRLMLTPELSISSYAADDLFLRPSFIAASDAAVRQLALNLAHLKDMAVVVGHAVGESKGDKTVSVSHRFNAASVLMNGKITHTYYKRELPNYQTFDERRYFTTGSEACVFEIQGFKIGLMICEDAWFDTPPLECKAAGAQILVNINASPYHFGKRNERYQRMQYVAKLTGIPLVYEHMAGGQDEFVYDGASFAVDAQGCIQASADSFVEEYLNVTVHTDGRVQGQLHPDHFPLPDDEADLWDALVCGLRDYIKKNKFSAVLLGLSGGIDSALVMALAVDAIGAERVRAVMMPSPYTASISTEDASEMAKRMGVRYDEISIQPEFEGFQTRLASLFENKPIDVTEENLQARIRGVMLMALSNKHGSLLLTTGNKSEVAVGYATLYGDMCGGFAPIKDVLKTTVFKLARWRNLHDPYQTCSQPIPERIINRPPSAELRPNQKDEDSLPPYDVLDAILSAYVENNRSVEDIIREGYERSLVERIVKLVCFNEYKRQQSAVGTRVTHRSFGRDWRYPITNLFTG